MKVHVYVTLKHTVLDAQGKTITDALQRLRFRGVKDVRQGKYFLLTLDDSVEPIEAEAEVRRIAAEVLTNPVIEEYEVHFEREGVLPDLRSLGSGV